MSKVGRDTDTNSITGADTGNDEARAARTAGLSRRQLLAGGVSAAVVGLTGAMGARAQYTW